MEPFSDFETPYFAQFDLHVSENALLCSVFASLAVKADPENLQAKPAAAEGEAKEGEAKAEGEAPAEGAAPAEEGAAPAEGEAAPAEEEAAPAEES